MVMSVNFTSEASYLPITSYNYFRLRNLSTNIIQVVRNCYKMKSDSRVLLSGFFMLCLSPEAIPFFNLTPFAMPMYPFNTSIVPLLHSNSAAFEAQKYSKWSAIVLLLLQNRVLLAQQLYAY